MTALSLTWESPWLERQSLYWDGALHSKQYPDMSRGSNSLTSGKHCCVTLCRARPTWLRHHQLMTSTSILIYEMLKIWGWLWLNIILWEFIMAGLALMSFEIFQSHSKVNTCVLYLGWVAEDLWHHALIYHNYLWLVNISESQVNFAHDMTSVLSWHTEKSHNDHTFPTH